MDYLGVKPTGTAAPTAQPRETTIDTVTKMENKGNDVFKRELQHSKETGELKEGEDELFIGPVTKGGYIYGTSSPNSRVRNLEYVMEPVKDPSGKIIGYENIADGSRWEIVKDGRKNVIRKISR